MKNELWFREDIFKAEPVRTTMMKGQIHGFEPLLQRSHAGAEFNTLKPALSIDMKHAGDKLLDTECFSLF